MEGRERSVREGWEDHMEEAVLYLGLILTGENGSERRQGEQIPGGLFISVIPMPCSEAWTCGLGWVGDNRKWGGLHGGGREV